MREGEPLSHTQRDVSLAIAAISFLSRSSIIVLIQIRAVCALIEPGDLIESAARALRPERSFLSATAGTAFFHSLHSATAAARDNITNDLLDVRSVSNNFSQPGFVCRAFLAGCVRMCVSLREAEIFAVFGSLTHTHYDMFSF